MKNIKVCRTCKIEFTQKKGNLCCSSRCSKEYKKMRSKEYLSNKIRYGICKNCNNQFIIKTYENVCSWECNVELYKIKYKCEECKSEFIPNVKSKKYCSKECCKEAQSKNIKCQKNIKEKDLDIVKKINKGNLDYKEVIIQKVNSLIQQGLKSGESQNGFYINYYNILGFNDELKQKILKRDNEKCKICEKPTGLHIHHIIPRQRGGNHNEDNLITLCSKCHMAIETKDIPHATNKCIQNYKKYHNLHNYNEEYITNKDKLKNIFLETDALFKKISKCEEIEKTELLINISEILDLFGDIN